MKNNLEILIKSLVLISKFKNDINTISNGNEFIKIHERNISDLKKIGIERNSTYITELISKYPKISTLEVDHFISSFVAV